MRAVSLVIIIVVAGCARETAAPQNAAPAPSSSTVATPEGVLPPIVYRTPTPWFLTAHIDPTPWIKKSEPDTANTWFKMSGESAWYLDWDGERQPFDLIVIHHSATAPDARKQGIEAHHQQRYVDRYQSENTDPYVKDLPVSSSHYVDGEERFIAYHHLIYPDGRVTTELQPLIKIEDTWFVDMVGWHSGNWSVNCRSVALCLMGDFNEYEPPEEQLQATAGVIAYYRTFNPALEVKPHSAFKQTDCPGTTWAVWGKRLVP